MTNRQKIDLALDHWRKMLTAALKGLVWSVVGIVSSFFGATLCLMCYPFALLLDWRKRGPVV